MDAVTRRSTLGIALMLLAVGPTACSTDDDTFSDQAIASSGTGHTLTPETPNLQKVEGGESWLEVGGDWAGRTSMSDNGEIQCTHRSVAGQRIFNARTSNFAEYDSGGDHPGNDFEVHVILTDNAETLSPSVPNASVSVVFSDSDGRHHSLIGADLRPDELSIDDTFDKFGFQFSGTANSIDAEQSEVEVAGVIGCAGVEEQSGGAGPN